MLRGGHLTDGMPERLPPIWQSLSGLFNQAEPQSLSAWQRIRAALGQRFVLAVLILSAVVASVAMASGAAASGLGGLLFAALLFMSALQGRLRAQNAALRASLGAAGLRTALSNERLLRRLGADLHDGPAQLIGLALLHIDALHPARVNADIGDKIETFDRVCTLLRDTLGEVRTVSAGLAPPQLEALTMAQALDDAIRNHERRTGVLVAGHINVRIDAPLHVKTCLYRFVQEGLNNAFRHAKGSQVSVLASDANGTLRVEVADCGPGLAPQTASEDAGFAAVTAAACGPSRASLGLAGLKDRIEACRGTLEIASVPGHGTRLIARLRFQTEKGALQ